MHTNLDFDLTPVVFNSKKSKQEKVYTKLSQTLTSKKTHEQKIKEQAENDEYVPEKPSLELRKMIQSQRQKLGINQKQLAQQMNIKQTVINDIEQGKIKPTPQQKSQLQRILKIKLPK